MNIRKLALASLAFTCVSCSHTSPSAPPSASPASAGVDNAAPIIVRIVSRGTTIVARAGVEGPVYSVEGARGEVLMPSMTLDQMTALHPEFANRVKTMQATAWAGVAAP